MKNGEFSNGEYVLRAKIDNSSSNMNMRDPVIYRIKHENHPITNNTWCIYPMYDFAHCISDAMEGVTHSLCSLEFVAHRPLYDWFIDNLLDTNLIPNSAKGCRPQQIEFSRLNLQYTVLSKRKLIQLVNENIVSGWDDPRMPTLCGVRRRGYPSSAIRLFCDRISVSKSENNIDMSVLENCVRETLDNEVPRTFAILKPLKVTITNLLNDNSELFNVDCHPKNNNLGKREIPFSNKIYIERDDFFDIGINGNDKPPKGFKRLVIGGNVRLKYAYVIKCDSVIRDSVSGEIIELLCSYDINTRAGNTPEGMKKTKGIIQWISQNNCVIAEIRLFDRLFSVPSPGKDQPNKDFIKDINKNSIDIISNALVENNMINCTLGDKFQFERLGYFCFDEIDNNNNYNNKLVFNKIVGLKDTWKN
jgi:glutaminyl-tRNA synthetase